MLLRPKQQNRFWAEWQAACRAQGWTKENGFSSSEIDQCRKRLLAIAGFTSLTLVDPLAGFDRVLEQLAILRTDLSGVHSAATMARTRLQYAIRALADAPYWQAITQDRFGTTDLDALTDDQLTQLRNTLTVRIRPLRKARKQTVAASRESAAVSSVEEIVNPF